MSLLDLAVPVGESKESVNMLLYGHSGVGKTTFLGSGRDKGKHDLIIAIENGTTSAARAGSQVNVLPVKTLKEFEEVIAAIEEEPERFNWVCIDSITKLQDLIWEGIIEDSLLIKPDRSPYKRELQEYHEGQLRLKSYVSRLCSSKANVIFTALATQMYNDDAEVYLEPAIEGKKGALAAWVCGEVDVVCYMATATKSGKTVRTFQMSENSRCIAKDRFGLFPKIVGNLTLEAFTDKLEQASAQEKTEEGK